MPNEQKMLDELAGKFPAMAASIRIARERRVFADAPHDQFRDVFAFAIGSLGFDQLCTITGVDEKENLAFLYHLARPDGVVFTLRTFVPKSNPVTHSITEWFPGGALYEREIEDLLGARFEGLPPGKRYPLPDDWPSGQFPLRKDWKAEMLEGTPPAEEKANG